uniref:U6 snRNA-associated Sm-like protein LSm4 n=1 Tax=Panagrellus redivivus TaxID=6233 RepID=A0A7E4V437_PANRE
MMLPLSLLKSAQNSALLIELKSGETYNGHMVSVDSFMNIHLRDAICTSKDGDQFHRVPEIFLRGGCVKVFRISPEAVVKLKEDMKHQRTYQKQNRQYKKQMTRGGAAKHGAGGHANGGPAAKYARNNGNSGR